ncbi:hypothetical protein [Roseomonas xinghualingensis]|uniref:hypothetical protein n=1 Tax=Roseomonas xinghualingensis TaxID=2986475 RepID=UPI0021F1D8C2|nr:hypothetical protein [Roseomonas sp. SXEYE001]MCV4206289.1 hypothetical protein [Roseomonas sp. SXEYE001]
MLNGSQLLQSFDESLAGAERQAAATQAEFDRLSARLDALRTAEAQALRELARLRLDMLGKDGGAAVERLDAASARARAVLEERSRAAAAAEEELAGKRRALAEATAARDREARRLPEAEEAAKREAAAARERLAADPEWIRLRDAAAEAARVAEHARQKADFARRDREEKGRPYMEDPLFAYLWQRGYGTAEYRAGGFTRMMDGFVARVARYEPARRSYALLTELPERLAGHASRMRQVAEEQAAALKAYERRSITGQAGGELPAIRAALEQAEDAVEAAHAALDEAERRRAALADENAGMREAMEVLQTALSQQSLRALREAAARTPTVQDDAIVARMAHAGAERAALEPQLAQRRAEVQAARERVQQLLSLRQEMRQRGYGGSHWNFGNGALLGMLLGQVLGGALSRGGFWDRMEQHRMPGGPWGGSPDGWDGGVWGGGTGGGGFGSDGGFQTGGGFGGGGGDFRTGGSF